jgi:DNA polymerase delta subunit 1
MPARRPLLSPISPDVDKIEFQQMEVDYYMGRPFPGMPYYDECKAKNLNNVPIMRFYGVTMEQNSVVCHVHGFFPYFYVHSGMDLEPTQLPSFEKVLNEKVQNGIFRVELQKKQTIYGFFGNQKANFLKIMPINPKSVPAVKRVLENEFKFDDNPAQYYSAFESNIEFILRFMIDLKVIS